MKSRIVGLALLTMFFSLNTQAQKTEMKLAYFVGDQHAMSQWLIRWSEQLEKGSGGRLVVKRLLPHFASDAEGRTMFEREATLHAAVTHVNVVSVKNMEEIRCGSPLSSIYLMVSRWLAYTV